jgi:hypothetical protein
MVKVHLEEHMAAVAAVAQPTIHNTSEDTEHPVLCVSYGVLVELFHLQIQQIYNI